MGRLYFHIGAVYAVHQKNHEKAICWYDKAIPMLTTKAPVTKLALPHRHGEALVSMGVSYWSVGERSKGLELTQMGADLVEAPFGGSVWKLLDGKLFDLLTKTCWKM